MRDSKYPGDQAELEALGPRRQEFEAWMRELDAEAKKNADTYGVYGKGDIWDTTGPACWISFFEDGFTPAEALFEDMTADG